MRKNRAMQMTRAWSALTAALIVATGLPVAAADDGAALSAKVDQAIGATSSYHIAVSGPNLSVDILEMGRDRVRVQSGAPAPTYESVVIGTAMYFRSVGTPWAAVEVKPVKRPRKNLLYMAAPDSKLEPLADRSEGGVTYGAFGSLALGNNQAAGTMECTYDKVTYLPHACTVVLATLPVPVHVTYDRWNDPANVVEAPAGIAPPTPSPAPAPSPGH